jgi:hypothetical protein
MVRRTYTRGISITHALYGKKASAIFHHVTKFCLSFPDIESDSNYCLHFFVCVSFLIRICIYFSVSLHYNYRRNVEESDTWRAVPLGHTFLVASLQMLLLFLEDCFICLTLSATNTMFFIRFENNNNTNFNNIFQCLPII